MSRLLPHVLVRRFWSCRCCANLLVTTPNTFDHGDPNQHDIECCKCSKSDCEQCIRGTQCWEEIDEAFFLLECNVSDEAIREAKEMVEGKLAWRSSVQHRREVPDYALDKHLGGKK